MIQELDRLNIDAYHEIVECIISALDARDPYTAGHSERVSDLAQMICGEMGITGECQNDIHVAAHLHDIGKMYDPVIGRFVLDNWDKVITVLQKDENSPEVLIQ